MFNADQRSYMQDMDNRPRLEVCPCGWYLEKDCVKKCVTGNRHDAPALVRRIREIYKQIDDA